MSRKTVREIKMLGLEKRRFPNKHYVYILEVHWSTGSTNKIYRRYSQLFEFQLALLQQFPVQGGKKNPEDRIIPFLPGKILFGRSHIRDVAEQRLGPISEYIAKLIALPHEVSESMTVTSFFEPTDEDIKPTRERAKKSVRESEIQNISDPVLLEQWVAIGDFKKEKRSECTLREGDVVDVIEKKATGWWFVDNAGNQGWVPASYLEPGSGTQDDEVEICAVGEEEEFITNNSYIAQSSDELGFERGVIVLVLQKNYDGWWLCRYQAREGLVPAAYLEPNTQDVGKSGGSLPREKKKVHSTLPTSASLNLSEVNSTRNWKSTKHSAGYNEGDTAVTKLQPNLAAAVTAKNFIPRRDSVKQTSMHKRKERECLAPLDKRMPDHNIDEYVALGEYESEDADGLSFKDGDILEVVEKHENGWWWASLHGRVGWVPSTYLEKSKTQRYSGELNSVVMAKRSNLLGLKPKRCTAKDAFRGQTQDMLSFKVGEVFDIVEKSDTGWWYLKNARGQEGWGPEDLLVEGEAVKSPKPALSTKVSSLQSSNNVTSQISNLSQVTGGIKPSAFSLENKVQLKPVSASKPIITDKPALLDKPSLPSRNSTKSPVPETPEKSVNVGKEGANKLVSLREAPKAPNKPVTPGKPASYAKVKISDSELEKPALPTRPRPTIIETNPPKPSTLNSLSPSPSKPASPNPHKPVSPKPSSEREESMRNQLSGVLAKRDPPSSDGKPSRPLRPVSQNMGQPKPSLPARNPTKPSLPVRPSRPTVASGTGGSGSGSSVSAYVTTRDYVARDEGCLSFKNGERAELVEKSDTGWWWMRIRNDEGWVSEEMVRLGEVSAEKRPAPVPPKPSGGMVALEDYKADYDASLSFRKGDRIEVLEKDSGSGWTWVKIGREEGWAPTDLIAQS